MKGVKGNLKIITSYKNNKTILKEVYCTNPFKITNPFYTDEDGMLLYIMSSSPGVLEGDRYDIDIEVKENSKVILTGQSYNKVFKMINGKAIQQLKAIVENNGMLKYIPCPTMLFQNSNYENMASINIEKGGTLIWTDVVACGRKALGEEFLFRRYYNRVEVKYDGQLIFLDNLLIEPKVQDLKTVGNYESYTHQGIIYICTEKIDECYNNLYEILDGKSHLEDSDIIYGITEVEYGVLVRILGQSSEELYSLIKECTKLEKLYNKIRKGLSNK